VQSSSLFYSLRSYRYVPNKRFTVLLISLIVLISSILIFVPTRGHPSTNQGELRGADVGLREATSTALRFTSPTENLTDISIGARSENKWDENLVVSFEFSNPILENFAEYTIVSVENCGFDETPGAPILPVRGRLIELPGELIHSELIATDNIELGIISLFTQAQDNSSEFTGPNPEIYRADMEYPPVLGQLYVGKWDGKNVIYVRVFPVSYIPSIGKLVFHRRIELHLKIKSSEVPNKPRHNPGGYLIIAPSAFMDELEPLKEIRERQGFKVYAEDVEWINRAWWGRDLPEKIRNVIKFYYRYLDVKWVLLAGDTNLIPTRYVTPKGLFRNGDVPTDYYYAGLDGSWDDDGDNLFGEWEIGWRWWPPSFVVIDEVDWFPEVYVGRLPARTEEEMRTIVNKLIKFERCRSARSPVFFLIGAKLAGSRWFPPYFHGDLEGEDVKEKIYESLPLQIKGNCFKYYQRNETLCERPFIRNEINEKDPLLINIVSHGSKWGPCLIEPRTEYIISTQDVPYLSNSGFLMYAGACDTNAFDEDECFGENLLKKDNGGAVAYIGYARVAWFTWVPFRGINVDIGFAAQDRCFWGEFFSEGDYTPGLSLYSSKVRFISEFNPDLWHSDQRKALLGEMLLGDPALRMIGQSDADSGKDAGNDFSTATSIEEGSYVGYLGAGDDDDFYKIYVDSKLDVSMVPPSDADFDLYLYDSNGSLLACSVLGTGSTESITYTAPRADYYFVRVHRSSGSGIYSLSLSIFRVLRDTTPPTTPVLDEDHCGRAWTNHNSPHWYWSASDPESGIAAYEVYCSWTGTSFLTTSTDYHPTLPDGPHYIQVRAQNGEGLWSKWSPRVWVYIDTQPPASSVKVIEPYWQNAKTVPFRVTAEAYDFLSGVRRVSLFYRYSPDNVTWRPWREFGADDLEPFSWNFDAPRGDGYYEFYTVAVDLAGNVEASPTEADARCGVDTLPPVSSVNPIRPYWRNDPPIRISAEASDPTPPNGAIPSGLKQVSLWYRFSEDNVSWTEWKEYGKDNQPPWEWSFSGPDAYYQFYSIASDVAGNVEEPPSVFDSEVCIDTTPPEIRLSPARPNPFSPDGDGIAENVSISYSLMDRLSPLCLVNVEILDMENRVVRHLFEGYEASGPRVWENHLHVWDGKADNGELCPDGPYYYRIEVSDLATNENHSIGEVVLNARLFHIKDASFSPKKFNPEKEKATLSYWLSEPAKALSIAIYDSFGNLVRHLVVREPRPAGLNTEVWDGRSDSGKLVGAGLYEARIWAVSHAGEGAEAVAKVLVVRLAAPELKIPSAPFRIREALFHPLCFNPELGENTELRYELPERALVGAIVYRITTGILENFYVLEGEHEERVDGCYLYVKYWAGFYYKEVRLEIHPIRHLVFNETRDAGLNVETWDGLDDDGNLVPSGWYFCRLVALSEKGEGDIVTRVVKVDRKMPVIANVSDSPDPFSPNGDGVDDTTKISYELRMPKDAPTDWLDVAIVIYRKGLEFELFDQEVRISAKYLVKIAKLKQRTRPNFWVWDGRDFLGKIVPNGTYGYLIFAAEELDLKSQSGFPCIDGFLLANPKGGEIRVEGVQSGFI